MNIIAKVLHSIYIADAYVTHRWVKWNIMRKITKEELARNLSRIIGKEVGKEGLSTLIYGWLMYRKYGAKYRHAIHARDYLFITEVQDLSEYAGYDLS